MVLKTGRHPGELKDSVCSPSGSTISGITILEQGGFRHNLISAVEAGSLRAYEIGLIENYDAAHEATGIGRYHAAQARAEVEMTRPQQKPDEEMTARHSDTTADQNQNRKA